MSIFKKYFGPSTLVAAAFIGPGTVTTCTLVGVTTGYSLLWALLFSIFATIVLQEMAARLGFVTGSGLGEALSKKYSKGIQRMLALFLVVGAVLIGNAAYEAGNIAGGVLGLELIIGEFNYSDKIFPLLIGLSCFSLLALSRYNLVEKILVGLVIVMSLAFLLTVILVKPDWSAVLGGFIPVSFKEHLLLVMALIGTTVVPYNLFLHASTISKKWNSEEHSISDIRKENIVSISLGGLVSILIVITAAASSDSLVNVSSAKDLAVQLEPVFGTSAKYLMGIGLMAAGISSALTAPLAAAYAAQGIFKWKDSEKNFKFRLIWMLILGIGIVVSMTGINLVVVIKFAQITNALLLPLVAIFLYSLCNNSKVLGDSSNKLLGKVIGAIILIIVAALSVRSFGVLFNLF